MRLEASRGLHLYLRTLEQALEDDVVTDDEMAILSVLHRAFGLESGSLGHCWAILRGQMASPIRDSSVDAWERRHIGDATTYQSALIAALDDEVITEDEWGLLDIMRRVMGIQPDEHALVEESIRAMAANHDGAESFTSRLDAYLARHPFA